MKVSVAEEVLTYLQEVPPAIVHTNCELCGGRWLVTIANQDRYGLPVRFVMCRQCGLVCLNPRWGHEPYNKFYTEYYRPFIVEWSGQETPTAKDARSWFQKMAQATELTRYLPPSPRVIDIGGGDGFLAEYIRDQYGAEVVIVEPNAREAEIAKAKGFEVLVDVFENCDFKANSFDLVVMLRTVDHLINASETFTSIRRILKEQGTMLVDGVDYFRRMAFCHDTIEPLKIDHCYYFSPETLPILMGKYGLLPIISDVTALPGQIVVLAQAGDPYQIPSDTWERYPGAEQRYYEWERLANRPNVVRKPGYVIASVKSELAWLANKMHSEWRNSMRRKAGG